VAIFTMPSCEWKHLLFLNYVIESKVVLPYLPEGVELDQWEGRAMMSLVGLTFKHTKIFGIPVPFQQDYEQINLRFYVKRCEGKEVRRGVVFLREIVPKWPVAFTAKLLFNEKYLVLPTSRRIRNKVDCLHVEYAWKRGDHWNVIYGSAVGDPMQVRPGSHEEFITERHWTYNRDKAGQTTESKINHQRWEVCQLKEVTLVLKDPSVFGADFSKYLSRVPLSTFLAKGSKVISEEVFPHRTVEARYSGSQG
jgi:uncharacterized protein